MTLSRSHLLLGMSLFVSSCAAVKPETAGGPAVAVGDAHFCAVAKDKLSYLGKELFLRGSYVTDLRHYSMLSATCDGQEMGFSLGYGPKQLSLTDPRVRGACEVACRIVVDAVVTGTLVKREDGIELDFSKMILPEDLAR